MVNDSMINLIGRTPAVRLRLEANSVAPVYAKLEMNNPFGMKDRVAKKAIYEAINAGILKPGGVIVESSSGTLAMGVTLVGTYLGYDVHIITDPRIDQLTLAKMKALGANVHIVKEMEEEGGWQRARLNYLHRFMESHPNAFWPRQYENPNNPLAYEDLANDLIIDIGRVDYLVAAVGSGGSLCGTAKALKKENPSLKVIAVDAVGSAIFQQKDQPHRLQGGLGNSLKPQNVDYSIIDSVHWLNDQEAFSWTLELARHEKIFAGNSSGSVYAVSRWLSTQVNKDNVIVGIFPDRGDRYFHSIYDEKYLRKHGIISNCLNMNPVEEKGIKDVCNWSYTHINRGEKVNEKVAVY
ncbi:PLP-dependent cysteine synthase family protein [Cytobacillus kochii]|uniref:Pyridoxal-5'-phosphate-dependent protein n=1 Tax=Cytobacillus kochii TaxID=859143 RepID=A0A248TII9_9BACI|nr:cysteine synthase family protein [Cytobacillus kochii]ASV67942.1 pyridoxal-5'-phosphate-dependent protein [Cytobacillus kochii]